MGTNEKTDFQSMPNPTGDLFQFAPKSPMFFPQFKIEVDKGASASTCSGADVENSSEEVNIIGADEVVSTNNSYRSDSLLLVKTANEWLISAKKKPKQKMLLGELWHEGELCIAFADSNIGKSILAVQAGDRITKGEPTIGLKLEAMAQPVVYFDFELSEKQFENRYSNNYQNHYAFSSQFYRCEINSDAEMGKRSFNLETQLVGDIEKYVSKHEVKCLIIDNITYLKHSTEKAQDALPLMKELKSLKKKYGLSILVLAHTPKRDASKPLTNNDLQGSKMLINFCDSAFAIGESFINKTYRYIKQIKQRNTGLIYGSDNVIICEVQKPDNFLQFKFVGFGKEGDHLKPLVGDKFQRISIAKELSQKGLSQREIAKELGVSASTVNGYLKQ